MRIAICQAYLETWSHLEEICTKQLYAMLHSIDACIVRNQLKACCICIYSHNLRSEFLGNLVPWLWRTIWIVA